MENQQNIKKKIIWENLENFNLRFGLIYEDQSKTEKFAGFWIRLFAIILDLIIFYYGSLLIISFGKIFYFDFLGFPNKVFFTIIDKKNSVYESLYNVNSILKDRSFNPLELILGFLSLNFQIIYQGLIVSNSSELISRLVRSLFLICQIIFFASGFQATPGKMIVGIYVGNSQDGSKISIYKSFFRCIIDVIFYFIIPIIISVVLSSILLIGNKVLMHKYEYIVFFFNFIFISYITLFFANILMVAFTKQKTALHDLICGTRVFYGRK